MNSNKKRLNLYENREWTKSEQKDRIMLVRFTIEVVVSHLVRIKLSYVNCGNYLNPFFFF